MDIAQTRMPKWVPIDLQKSKITFKSYSLTFNVYTIFVLLEVDREQRDVAELNSTTYI